MLKVPTYQDTSEGLVVNFPFDSTVDRLSRQAQQLRALLLLMLADDAMANLAEEIQNNLQWLASDLSEEVLQLADINVNGNTEKVRISNEDLSIAERAVAASPRSKTSKKKTRQAETV